MKKYFIKSLLIALFSLAGFHSQAATDYQDWWWNPALNGMGINVGQQGNTLVVAWYHFSSDGNPTYLLFYGPLVNNRLDSKLERAFGPAPDSSYDPNRVERAFVGTASLVFSSDTTATLTYDFDSIKYSMSLQRFTYSEVPLTGTWRFGGAGTVKNCYGWFENGDFIASGTIKITKKPNGSYVSIINYDNDDSCTFNHTITQSGVLTSGTGTFTCSTGISGPLTIEQMRVSGDFLMMEYMTKATSGNTCIETGKFGAIK